jgi:hypothetical protein
VTVWFCLPSESHRERESLRASEQQREREIGREAERERERERDGNF